MLIHLSSDGKYTLEREHWTELFIFDVCHENVDECEVALGRYGRLLYVFMENRDRKDMCMAVVLPVALALDIARHAVDFWRELSLPDKK